MSCNKSLYEEEEKACRETFLKDVDETKVSYWFYKGINASHLEQEFDNETHTLYLIARDDLAGTGKKSLEAIRATLNLDYDYLIKTNVSTYLNIDKIVKEMETWEGKDDENIYGGRFIVNEASKDIPFPRGYFMAISKSLAKEMLEVADRLVGKSGIPLTDDTLMGLSLLYVINNKCNDTFGDLDVHVFRGEEFIYETMENLKFKIGPKSFFQTNSRQAYRLYSVVRELADLKPHEVVYDLYTGTGTIAQFISARAKKVVGIEYVPEAIEDAKVNAALNNIQNTEFFAGDMKDVLNEDFIAAHGTPNVIVTDPPRAGMHPDVVDVILKAAPDRIVYVSCNPATQARDIALLDQGYRVAAVQPVDMFPHTQHVEVVTLLIRR